MTLSGLCSSTEANLPRAADRGSKNYYYLLVMAALLLCLLGVLFLLIRANESKRLRHVEHALPIQPLPLVVPPRVQQELA